MKIASFVFVEIRWNSFGSDNDSDNGVDVAGFSLHEFFTPTMTVQDNSTPEDDL